VAAARRAQCAAGEQRFQHDCHPNPAAGAVDKAYGLRLRIRPNGDITVINERNGYNKSYKAGG